MTTDQMPPTEEDPKDETLWGWFLASTSTFDRLLAAGWAVAMILIIVILLLI